jgi:hypothetical protein
VAGSKYSYRLNRILVKSYVDLGMHSIVLESFKPEY